MRRVHGWISYDSFFLQMLFINMLLYNLVVPQLTFVTFVVFHLLLFFLRILLFLYLCGACCHHAKFLFFIFVVDIRVSGVGVLLCFVVNVSLQVAQVRECFAPFPGRLGRGATSYKSLSLNDRYLI